MSNTLWTNSLATQSSSWRTQRGRLFVLSAVFFAATLYTFVFHTKHDFAQDYDFATALIPSFDSTETNYLLSQKSKGFTKPLPKNLRRSLAGRHVAIWDTTGYHDEVHGAAITAFAQFQDVQISHYKPLWRWHFNQLLSRIWSATAIPFNPDDFMQDIKIRRGDGSGRPMITDIFLPTCDNQDKPEYWDALKAEWESRDMEDRFRIICVRHWNYDGVMRNSPWWMDRNAMTHLTLGDHLTAAIAEKAANMIPNSTFHVETWVPLFLPSPLGDEQFLASGGVSGSVAGDVFQPGSKNMDWSWKYSQTKMIDSAAIQGNMAEDHRRTNDTLNELYDFISKNPYEWGYRGATLDHPIFEPLIPDPSNPLQPKPFQFQLVGGLHPLIPPRFQNIVTGHPDSTYPDFIQLLNGVDVILPCFWDSSPYTIDKASSTIGMAASSRTPLMMDEAIHDAYGFFPPDFSVMRPKGMSEMQYIQKTRTGQIIWDREQRGPRSMQKAQEEWLIDNAYMLSAALNRPLKEVQKEIVTKL